MKKKRKGGGGLWLGEPLVGYRQSQTDCCPSCHKIMMSSWWRARNKLIDILYLIGINLAFEKRPERCRNTHRSQLEPRRKEVTKLYVGDRTSSTDTVQLLARRDVEGAAQYTRVMQDRIESDDTRPRVRRVNTRPQDNGDRRRRC